MPLMGSLYVGASGLQTNQNALNTTAHNMSNIDTTGYARQQVSLSTKTYNTLSINASSVANQQVGLGVTYSEVRQVRDYFLDQTYRKESGRSAFYEASSEALDEVESLLGELYGVSFSEALDNLWEAVQELAKTPENSVNQGLLMQRSSEFLTSATSVYDGLNDYQDNLNLQVKEDVDRINEIGQNLKTLNDSIRKIEIGGTENPNDLNDQRNKLLDELSGYVNITYDEDIFGSVMVSIEGEPFVTGDMVYEMGLQQDSVSGFYTPFWPQNSTYTLTSEGKKVYNIEDSKVFDITQTISSDLDTDIGGLKARIIARGDHRADYTDISDEAYYDSTISQSVIMNVQAEFDQLIHSVVTAINGVFDSAADTASGYLCGEDGTPFQIFQKIASDGYDATGTYIDEVTTLPETLYTIANLQINSELTEQPSKLGFIKADGSTDQETADALKALFAAENYNLNPNVAKKNTFTGYYSDLVSQIANSGQVYSSIVGSQKDTVAAIETARQQVIGVSSDEELTNMIKYQNAYNAASRYINVIDEMLEHILTALG